MNTYTPTQLLAAIWCAVGAPSAALAQQPALTAPFEVFAGPTYWHANAGSWGAHLGAGLRFPAQGRQLSVAAVVFHGLARSDSTNPSVTSVELEASLAVAMVRRRAQTNLFLSFGIGRTHIDASRQNGALAGCTPQNFCMAGCHVVSHRDQVDVGAWSRLGAACQPGTRVATARAGPASSRRQRHRRTCHGSS